MPDREVELRPMDALMVPTDATEYADGEGVGVGEGEDEDLGVGVGVAETEAGYMTGKRLFTSDGSAWYHAGVLPASNDEASCEANAAGDATA